MCIIMMQNQSHLEGFEENLKRFEYILTYKFVSLVLCHPPSANSLKYVPVKTQIQSVNSVSCKCSLQIKTSYLLKNKIQKLMQLIFSLIFICIITYYIIFI